MISKIINRLKILFRRAPNSLENKITFRENYPGIPYVSSLQLYEPNFYGGTVEEITGYSSEDFKNGLITWDRIIHPEDLKLFFKEDEKLQSIEGHVFDIEYRIIKKNGEVRWVKDLGQVFKNEEGNHLQLSGTVYDITTHKETADNLSKALGISPEHLSDTDKIPI